MSKVVLTDQERQEFFKNFLEAIQRSNEKGLLSDFMLDFFSETELDSFIKRLEVFKRLHSGHSYAKVNQDLSVSPITASKVSKSLKDSSDDFRDLIEELTSPNQTISVEREEKKDDKRSSYLG